MAALEAWLAAAGIPLEQWGRGQAKTVADLWTEIASGEATLRDNPPRREVAVAQVLIRRGDQLLIEIEQELSDGRRRMRQRPPSEKLQGGEDALAAARRCLAEELGLALPVTQLYEVEPPDTFSRVSPSYPGLPTRYAVHTVRVDDEALPLAELPPADFWRDNRGNTDPIRRHLWGWR